MDQPLPASPRRGFTLIELLVVIGIIVLLMSILLPAIGTAQEMGRTTRCAANMRSIGQACAAYSAANEGTIVPFRTYFTPVNEYYHWPNALVDGHYIDAPQLDKSQGGAGPNAQGVFFCPSGNMEMFPPNLTNNGAIPANRQDIVGAEFSRYQSVKTRQYIDCWYAMNANNETSTSTGTPGRAIDSTSDKYTTILLVKHPTEMVLFFDGIGYHHTQVNANRLNARHGNRTQTNLLMVDGHVETWYTKNLPGGLGAATLADVSLANIRAKYGNQPLKWYLEQ